MQRVVAFGDGCDAWCKLIASGQQASDDWYLAAASNEQPRQLKVPLNFLGAGCYQAILYRDGDPAHWRDNPAD